eukprot:1810128-Rhodomonas_salina.1
MPRPAVLLPGGWNSTLSSFPVRDRFRAVASQRRVCEPRVRLWPIALPSNGVPLHFTPILSARLLGHDTLDSPVLPAL